MRYFAILILAASFGIAGCSKPSATTADKSAAVAPKAKGKPKLKLVSNEGVLEDEEGGKYYWRSYFLKKVRFADPPLTTADLKKKIGAPDSTTIGFGGDATKATWVYKQLTVDENNDKIDQTVEIRFKNDVVVAVEFNP